MKIGEINKIVIGLFFIYIVLFSSDIQLILNCGLQKMMKENIYFRHVLIFISIYLFVFVLKWYNIDVIVVKDEFNNIVEKKIQKDDSIMSKLIDSTSYLTDSLLLTLIAYVVFLVSTKVDASIFKYLVIIIFITILLQIISKAYNQKLHKIVMNNSFIFSKDEELIIVETNKNNVTYDKFIINLHNLTYLLYVISIALMIIGVYMYYIKQRKNFGNKWSWNKFIFGIQKCKNVN